MALPQLPAEELQFSQVNVSDIVAAGHGSSLGEANFVGSAGNVVGQLAQAVPSTEASLDSIVLSSGPSIGGGGQQMG